MNLKKAVEINDLNLKLASKSMPPDVKQALIISNGAIHRILTMRSYNIPQAVMPLPGEDPVDDPGLSEDQIQRIKESPLVRRDML